MKTDPPMPVVGLAALSLAVLAGGAVLLSSCAKDAGRRGGRPPIVIAQAERRNVPYDVPATGTVEPLQSAAVSSNVGGLVTKVSFREGDDVRAGQVLFQIDSRPLQAEVRRLSAVLARDRAQALMARSDLDRATSLAQRGVISAQELDQKRTNASALAATVSADSAALSGARLELGYATVRAPISGRTGGRSVDVGDLVKAADPAAPLVTINQLRPIRVRFTVPQTELPEIRRRASDHVRVDVSTGSADSSWIEGKLVFVDNAVDQASGTVLLKAEFVNASGELWPGEFVRVRMRLFEEPNATVVPAVALTEAQGGTFVYVVKPDTTVEVRPVQVARSWDTWAVLTSGVSAGETVVVDGQLRLSPGAKATVKAPRGPAQQAETAEAARR
jgi:multidrug efflux system membrane fusion protein